MIHDEVDSVKNFSLPVWKKMLGFVKHELKPLVVILITLALMTVFDILFPLFQGYLIENYVSKGRVDGLYVFGAVLLAAVIVQGIFVVLLLRACINLELALSRTLRNKIFSKFQNLPVSYFSDKPVGYLVSKTMSDTERIASILAWGAMDFGWSVLFIVGMTIPMLILNVKLGLIILAIIPAAILVSLLFQRKLLPLNRKVRKANSVVSAALNEGITGAKTAKTLNAGGKLNTEFYGLTGEMLGYAKRYNKLSAVYGSLLSFFGTFIIAVILLVGEGQYNLGGMNIGQLSTFLSYSLTMVFPIVNIAEGITNLVANQANVERTVNILSEPPAITDSPEVIERYGDFFQPKYDNWEAMDGDIEFENVSFRYPAADRDILTDFRLKIAKGQTVAIVGETGAGKSTIVNLICRFYEPTTGRILIDGRDYRDRSQLWLNSNMSYVLQTPHLFSGTIRDNIRYGRLTATDEEVEAAGALLNVDKIAAKLPKGYDTEVGECGDSLSTGEKQLITFARAIIAEPKVIILDEATSSIDTETERMVQAAIETVLKGRTAIVVAHRLSTIKNADIILVIEDGKILESGNHKSLMQQKGHYSKLYRRLYELEVSDKIFSE